MPYKVEDGIAAADVVNKNNEEPIVPREKVSDAKKVTANVVAKVFDAQPEEWKNVKACARWLETQACTDNAA